MAGAHFIAWFALTLAQIRESVFFTASKTTSFAMGNFIALAHERCFIHRIHHTNTKSAPMGRLLYYIG